MSLDFSKLLQNLEVRLRGRNALLFCVITALTVMFWLALRDYTSHPILSTGLAVGIPIVLIVILMLAFLSKPRPEEVPPRSLIQLGRFYFASGMTSQQDMMELVRNLSGISPLPPPNAKVDGSAANEKDYVPLSPAESDAFVSGVQRQIQEELARFTQAIMTERQLPEGESGRMVDIKRIQPPERKS